MEFVHIPVMLNECIEGLNIKKDGIYLDCTLGGAGHSSEILKRIGKNGLLIGVDKDLDAITVANERLSKISNNYKLVHDDYKNIVQHLEELGVDKLDGILIDLGISSYQVDNAQRGFSYMNNARLDMRMDRQQSLSAYEVVNTYSEKELVKILFEYGEEKFARKIAQKIVSTRTSSPIETTEQLRTLIENCYPMPIRFKHGNPAKKSFQAIRIEVNDEIKGLYEIIETLALRLKQDGQMCVIAFHSLEDRIVKQCFQYLEKDCICDPHAPICTCDKVSEIKIITKKPITASEEELKLNSRAECAKLRIIKRK